MSDELRISEISLLQKISEKEGSVLISKISSNQKEYNTFSSAAEWLKEKGLINVKERKESIITCTPEGDKVIETSLPERILIRSIIKSKEPTVKQIKIDSKLSNKEFSAGLGQLTSNGWGKINKGVFELVDEKEPDLTLEEKYLELLKTNDSNKKRTVFEKSSKEEQDVFEKLKKRGLVKIQPRSDYEVEVTQKGWKIIKSGIKVGKDISQLTPDLIRTGGWKDVNLRKFELTTPVLKVPLGKKHPFNSFIQEMRRIFLEMGFNEIRDELVEEAFWNFDALFQPQDHPAREMQDTFYLKDPNKTTLPKEEWVNNVGKTHENGWTTGSTGWGNTWDSEIAKQLVMRTHTTCNTIRYLAENPKPPVKVFSIDRVYRNEKLDYKHAAEFYQMEGIIMDKGVTLRDLKGILTQFYNKMGFKKIKFWPSYFPYTEPSLQSSVFMPDIGKWVELCGMGIFRPEVTKPLGIKHPVLAWGGGVERLLMLRLGITDIRVIYRNDLNWLRSEPLCQQ
ncbi:MAG: phenylalanine--tRNA ligase subunit alpha [Candidatus Ranarchaeia archaeon]